jgi:hypothetical protein
VRAPGPARTSCRPLIAALHVDRLRREEQRYQRVVPATNASCGVATVPTSHGPDEPGAGARTPDVVGVPPAGCWRRSAARAAVTVLPERPRWRPAPPDGRHSAARATAAAPLERLPWRRSSGCSGAHRFGAPPPQCGAQPFEDGGRADTTRSNSCRGRTAPSRRTRAGSRRTTRSTRASLARPERSHGPAPMSTQCRPARASWAASRSWSLLGEGHREQPPVVATDHQRRPVLALGGVVLVRHPGPDHLTGVGQPVLARAVLPPQRAGEVARVRVRARRGRGTGEGSGRAAVRGTVGAHASSTAWRAVPRRRGRGRPACPATSPEPPPERSPAPPAGTLAQRQPARCPSHAVSASA